MITQIIVGAGEGPLGGLFVDRNHADRRVIAVFRPDGDTGDHIRINAGEVVVIVGLLSDLRAVRVSRRRVDAGFLHESSVRSPTIARRPIVIIPAD